MARKGRRCAVCGASHATCGDPSDVVLVDSTYTDTGERLERYEVTVGAHRTVMKLHPSTAEQLYPGARPLDRARVAPVPVAPTPEPVVPVSVPAGTGAMKPLGGGWYLLSDGSRVRGLEAAREAQEALG